IPLVGIIRFRVALPGVARCASQRQILKIDTGLRLSRRVNVSKCEELNRAPQSAQIAARHELWAVGRVNPGSESRAGGLLNDGRPPNLAACRSANPVVAGRMKQSLNSHGV